MSLEVLRTALEGGRISLSARPLSIEPCLARATDRVERNYTAFRALLVGVVGCEEQELPAKHPFADSYRLFCKLALLGESKGIQLEEEDFSQFEADCIEIAQLFKEEGFDVFEFLPSLLVRHDPKYWREVFSAEEFGWLPKWALKQVLKGYTDPQARIREIQANLKDIHECGQFSWASASLIQFVVTLHPFPQVKLREIQSTIDAVNADPEFRWASKRMIELIVRVKPDLETVCRKLRAHKSEREFSLEGVDSVHEN